jgi:hypothetical protein
MEGLFGGGGVVALGDGRATLLVGVQTALQWGVYEKGGTGRGVRGCLPRGYGSVLAEVSCTQPSSQLRATQLRGGRWTTRFEAMSTHFGVQNLVQMCMEHGEEHRGCRVHVCTDNVGAAFTAGKGCMKHSLLNALAIQLWTVCLQIDLAVSTQHLCGDSIIVSGADGLRREEDVYDCQVSSRAFQCLWEWGGPFEVDCCAGPGAVQRDPGVQVRCWGRCHPIGQRRSTRMCLHLYPTGYYMGSLWAV